MEYINYNSNSAKSSRNGYVWYCMFEYFISILVTDAFLAKLLKNIGMSDSLTGIISSFVSLAFLFQLLSVFILKRKINAKAICITFEYISQLCFVFLYAVPFLPVPSEFKSMLVVVAIMVAYALKYVVSSILFKWTNTYVDPMHRGSFSAIKEMISLFGGIVFSFVMGVVTDKFFECGNTVGAFIFIAISIFALAATNFFCLLKIKNCDVNTAQSAKAVSLVAPYAFYVHAKDFHIKSGVGTDPGEGYAKTRGGNYRRGAIVGHGDVPVKCCLSALKMAGYKGGIAIEFEGMEDNIKALSIGIANLRRYIEEVGM